MKKITFWTKVRFAWSILKGDNVVCSILNGDHYEQIFHSNLNEEETISFLMHNVQVESDMVKKIFAEGVAPAGDKGLLVGKIAFEQGELAQKYERLKAFLSKGKDELVATIGEKHYELLRKQKKYMSSYLHILSERTELLFDEMQSDFNEDAWGKQENTEA